jgi:hypothetical protein
VIENLKKAQAKFAALKAKYDVPEWVKGAVSKADLNRARYAYLYGSTVNRRFHIRRVSGLLKADKSGV